MTRPVSVRVDPDLDREVKDLLRQLKLDYAPQHRAWQIALRDVLREILEGRK